jgi:hypothetical protein
MSNTNSKIEVLVASLAILLGAAMIANPIAHVNAQGNQSQGNKTNATGGAKAVTVTKIDVDPIMKALKDAYPKAGDIKDDNVDAGKDLKDAKEAAKTLVAASLLRGDQIGIFKYVTKVCKAIRLAFWSPCYLVTLLK